MFTLLKVWIGMIHGKKKAISTIFGEIEFADLSDIMADKLKGKRIFLSACEAVNCDFANAIIPSSGCNSIAGPTTKLLTNDALIFWSSFYHIIFRENPIKMNKRIIKGTLLNLMKLHKGLHFKYF
jgi:hypothetical protein